ncbi:MAG: UDP-forming cellulose synthase catalytic subunit, partial [Legionellales bacterium]
MSLIPRLLTTQQTYKPIERLYNTYRHNGSSIYAIYISMVLIALSWLFLPLESPNWQLVRSKRESWFSQIEINKPRSGDVFRFILQALWFLCVRQEQPKGIGERLNVFLQGQLQVYNSVSRQLNAQFSALIKRRGLAKILFYLRKSTHSTSLIVVSTITVILLTLCITQPFTPLAQCIFMLLMWCTAMSIRNIPGRMTPLMLAVLSVIVSCRYMWWRYTTTLVWADPVSMFFGVLLIIAETYIFVVLILGFFQSIWPLQRNPVSLPKDTALWPSVDVFIATYNEDLNIVSPGVYAALGIDWPKDKITIYLLDDGNRPQMKAFAQTTGIEYIVRASNEHAKAGNINNALKHTKGDLIAIFDCDHIPTHTFLQLTVGWFLQDSKLAILQTPHHFFSPDPFERNLGSFMKTPNENALFYGVVQDGNDTWGSTYFCGSAGIMRRTALEDIGGFAVESVTEDAHTSLRLQRKGYTSAYIRIPLAAGLATESLSGHIGQRIRWARGMAQILRLDNPLFGKGLKLAQRLCYFNAMLHFLSGVPRLIFLTTPIAFLCLHANLIYADASMVLLYAMPHIIHAALANSCIQGKYRHFLWNEIYETVMAWYIAIPTTVALITPHKGTFNVTAKGGLVEKRHADWHTARPYLFLLLLNLIGLIVAMWRLIHGPSHEHIAVIITMLWVIYNIAILGGALGVDIEAKQVRKAPRVDFSMLAALIRADGHAFPCTLHDYSGDGVGITVSPNANLKQKDSVSLVLKNNKDEFVFSCEVRRVSNKKVGLQLQSLTLSQQINFIQCTFARADTWALWQTSYSKDKPLQSFRDVMAMNFRSYINIIQYTPRFVRWVLMGFTKVIMYFLSFAPRS